LLNSLPQRTERPWLRAARYREKYDIGQTTQWSLERKGKIRVRRCGKLVFVLDEPPAADDEK
jgi:hypothetical protein